MNYAKKWAVIDTPRDGYTGDEFDSFHETKDEAIVRADSDWDHMGANMRYRRHVMVAEVTLDEDGCIDYGVGYTPVYSPSR